MATSVEEHAHAVVAVLERWRQPENWYELAACRGLGPDLFFPSDRATEPTPEAVQLCAACPVVEECAEAGRRERSGVWGGQLRRRSPSQSPGSPLARITHRYESRGRPRLPSPWT